MLLAPEDISFEFDRFQDGFSGIQLKFINCH